MGFTQSRISLRRNRGGVCPNPEYSLVCADTIFLSGRCTDWVMSSELNPNCSWDSVMDASLTICWEIAPCDRQDANCESFSNVTTDWHRLTDKTSRCVFRWQAWRSYIHYKRKDLALAIWNAPTYSEIDWYVYHGAARVSFTRGQRSQHSHTESSQELFEVKQNILQIIQTDTIHNKYVLVLRAPYSRHSLFPGWAWG